MTPRRSETTTPKERASAPLQLLVASNLERFQRGVPRASS